MEQPFAAAIRLAWSVGHELYLSGLHGCEAESTRIRNKRMQNPVVGDVVLEVSSFYLISAGRDFWATPEEAIGVLERIQFEPITGPWEEDVDNPRRTEKVWYMKRFRDGEIIRWVNADFVAVHWPAL